MEDELSYEDRWIMIAEMQGHKLARIAGKVDQNIYADEQGHTGPQCSKCGWGACVYCVDFMDIKECRG